MNALNRWFVLSAVSTLTAGVLAAAEPAAPAPGWVDFGTLTPAAEGKFVEVNLSEGLLKFAATLAAKQEPDAAGLIRNLRHVRVNVLDLTDANRAATVEKVTAIRQQLAAAGWAPIVDVREPPKGDDVRIFAKMRGEEAIEGLVITVIDGDHEVVLVNVVGDIKPEQIATLAEHYDIKALKHFQPAKPKAS
ncbi:MAG TPA: DUF4252 domain-containing protein [Opitutaceae bacterium]|nr:DUF4252 domain-containing protein [Opitutaceae bacterium]